MLRPLLFEHREAFAVVLELRLAWRALAIQQFRFVSDLGAELRTFATLSAA